MAVAASTTTGSLAKSACRAATATKRRAGRPGPAVIARDARSLRARRPALPKDRFQQWAEVFRRVEEMAGILGAQSFSGSFSRGDGDRRRLIRHAAADVVDRVA